MSDGHPQPTLSPAAAATLTFIAAASVLVLEIAAGRLLAPYVGVSLTTYTGIIGVILGGIALGAWAGGRLADRGRPERLLGPTLALGGLAAMASVPAVGVVGGLELGADPVAIVVLAAIGFVAPAAILSAVAPMIVRASLVDLASSGSLVGRLSAVGTLGAISGTFLTGFVLLGLVPTRPLIIATGGLLVLVGLAFIVLTRRRGPTGLLIVVAALGLAGTSTGAPEPCQRESAYFCMRVVADGANASGRTLVLDRVRHAYVDLADPTSLSFRYVRWFADATAGRVDERNADLRAVHVGGGGFTFPRYLAAVAPGSRHVVLELDAEVLSVAREQLGFEPSDAIEVRVGDARLGMRGVADNSADLVVGDAFGSLAVPWHLTTTEFLSGIDRVLRPDGLYVMNLIDGPELRFARAEGATFARVWEHRALLASASALDGRGGGNVVLLGSHAPLDLAGVRARLEARGDTTSEVLDGAGLDAFIAGSSALTDDFAPVDQLVGR